MKPLIQCPICRSRRIHRVCENVEFKGRAGTFVVPDVSFDRCDACGESFYDHEANQKIDAVVFGKQRRTNRRKSA